MVVLIAIGKKFYIRKMPNKINSACFLKIKNHLFVSFFLVDDSNSIETRRAIKIAGYSWPINASRLAKERAIGCTGVMSP